MATRRVNVFTIPPGIAFLTRFVTALRAGDIIEHFPAGDDPLELATATILVPTQRAAQALRQVFIATSASPVAVLPRILTFGQLGEIDDGSAEPDDEAFADAAVPDGVSPTERRLVLTRFIIQWAEALKGAIRNADDPTQEVATLVTAGPAHAWRLAGDLAALIDEMAIEGIPWTALDNVAPQEFDEYWKLTLGFLRIAMEHWPAYLDATGLIDRVARQGLIVDAQIARIHATPGVGPVIAIGSTGTNKATARLLGALANSPRGAVVLPGLDMELDARTWQLIAGEAAHRIEPSAGHPQAALHRLLTQLQIGREDVRELGTPDDEMTARARFLTQALRPADTTDVWAAYRASHSEAFFAKALRNISLVEAEDEREEALCLAIAMREALETPDRTAYLITPDRGLAMRVRAELARWNIEVDDSAGESLRVMPLGALSRLMLDLVTPTVDVAALLALLSHPLVRLGLPSEEVTRLARLVEIGVARALTPACERAAPLAAAARATSQGQDAHPARRAIPEADWDAIEALMARLDEALASLHALDRRAPLSAWTSAHRQALDTLTQDDDALPPPEQHLVEALFEGWSGAHADQLTLEARDYTTLFDQALQETQVRQERPAHPRLLILGLLEARLLRADLVLLGGLDETIWPPQSRTDAFLNRPMRAQLGLTPPERRIGQTAHDFVQAIGTREVIISRARKRGGSPTVPSRLLQRMSALAGPCWVDCLQRGTRYVGLAQDLERPNQSHMTAGGRRPEPRPPLDLRPTTLSVTRIETLRRDPYSIYAERILRLKPLDPIGQEAGMREAGIILHDLMSSFSQAPEAGPDAARRLVECAREKFAEFLKAPDFRAFRWPRIVTQLEAFVAWNGKREGSVAALYVERRGSLPLPMADGSIFNLTAQADRIERRTDGSLVVIDYKSGRVPSPKEINAGFAPQLTLEAAMLERNAFEDIPAGTVADAVYVKLGGDDGIDEKSIVGRGKTLKELVDEQFGGLRVLIEQFRDAQTAYVSRPFPQFVSRYGVYDHLARVKEWSSTIEES